MLRVVIVVCRLLSVVVFVRGCVLFVVVCCVLFVVVCCLLFAVDGICLLLLVSWSLLKAGVFCLLLVFAIHVCGCVLFVVAGCWSLTCVVVRRGSCVAGCCCCFRLLSLLTVVVVVAVCCLLLVALLLCAV